ncbi:MAG: PspC domain-containing protein [Oscillospiraceae bacterium]|nr:PspC domain-containing protein [Oscillospiraceae bacterium]
MQNRLERQIRIPLSTADNTNRIGIVGIFNTFMDLATEHGDMLGVGMDKLADKGLIWVAATLFTGFFMGIILYVACVFIIPEEPKVIDGEYREK